MVTNNEQSKGVEGVEYVACRMGKERGFFASQIKGMEFEVDDTEFDNRVVNDVRETNNNSYARFEEMFGASVQHYVSWYQSHHPDSTHEHAVGFLEQMVAKTSSEFVRQTFLPNLNGNKPMAYASQMEARFASEQVKKQTAREATERFEKYMAGREAQMQFAGTYGPVETTGLCPTSFNYDVCKN